MKRPNRWLCGLTLASGIVIAAACGGGADATRARPAIASAVRASTATGGSDARVHDASADGVDATNAGARGSNGSTGGAEAFLPPSAPGDHPSLESYVLKLFRQELASKLRPQACSESAVVTTSLAEFIQRRMTSKPSAPIARCEVRKAAMVCIAPQGERDSDSVEIACRESALGHDCVLLVEPEPHFVMETVTRGDAFGEDSIKNCYSWSLP